MSIPVALEKLRAEAERFGATPYLLSVSEDGRPHSVAISASWDGGALVARAGKRTAANVAARPKLSLLWAPVEPGGYSLIVDGDGAVEGAGEDARVVVRPTRGVLHRPAASPTAMSEGCSADCKPILR
ncbi:MAG TPA: pyridoxamine 5'-phosphate oxidase family protein [Myxococcota bacterium]|jgi:hypothetical protein